MFRYLVVFTLICFGNVQSLSQELKSQLVEYQQFVAWGAEGARVLVLGKPDPEVLEPLAAEAREIVVVDSDFQWEDSEPFDLIAVPFTLGDFEDPERALYSVAPSLKPGGRVLVYVELHPEKSFFEIADALLRERELTRPPVAQFLNGSVADYRSVFHEEDSITPRNESEKHEQLELWLEVFGGNGLTITSMLTFREAWSMEEYVEGLTERFGDQWEVPEALRADFFAELASRYGEFIGPLRKEDSVADNWPAELPDDALIYQQPLSGFVCFETW